MDSRKTRSVADQIHVSDELFFYLILIIVQCRIGNAQMIPERFRQILIRLVCLCLIDRLLRRISVVRHRRLMKDDIVLQQEIKCLLLVIDSKDRMIHHGGNGCTVSVWCHTLERKLLVL